MKLWILRPIDENDEPWNPWYDKAFGFIVRAETAVEARALAEVQAGDESRDSYKEWGTSEVIEGYGKVWQNPSLSSCIELTPDGPAAVIMKDFHSA